MVVDDPQVGLLQQMGRRGDRMEHRIERGAGVHQRQHLAFDRFEKLGGIGQRRLDAVAAEDREAVSGKHQLCAEGCHLAQPSRPFAHVALHLLWVASVGSGVDKEVAGREDLLLRHPRPGGVFSLAARVPQFEGEVSLAECERLRVGDVRVAARFGETVVRRGDRELAGVDRRIPADRLLVAVKVAAEVLVAVDQRPRPALLRSLRLKRPDAEDVVHVVVRKDCARQPRTRPPLPHLLEQRRCVLRGACIQHHEAIAGVQRVRAGDALVVEHAIGHFLGSQPHASDWVGDIDGVHLAVPDLVGVFAQCRHRKLLGL